ncbi:ATP-dependent helicase HrpB [Hydrogenimonas sp. SS33]|uniref:ATP-dependent helicase HrpB n=1 Tax=Hydrogenimonas leucolamina TaxID=2954236 RepID=UPI00336C1C02
MNSTLPIHSVLPELQEALSSHRRVVLQAAPGAGKTTVVPLALMEAPWLKGRKIVMLEPRRLAARAAAMRMAQTLGEKVGRRVGYRMRGETKVSGDTRVEVVTEGVLTQILLNDPALEGVGLLIFDEFHERSIHADLSLALSLESQEILREDLKILLMSATLQTGPVAELLKEGEAPVPVIACEGRSHPVRYRYLDIRTPPPAPRDIAAASVGKTVEALQEEAGDILVFLPGAKEIREAERLLRQKTGDDRLLIAPLYGTLDARAQRLAVEPATDGRRKVVLATNIAETSLTIEGVRVVVDSGWERSVFYDAASGMNRYETLPISRNSATQRAGRAGREAPGLCLRLWHENRVLREYATPEILRSDLAPLMMNLAAWGARPETLRWIDPPPKHAVEEADALLKRLGMVDEKGNLTGHGKEAMRLRHHPRIAHMLLKAKPMGLGVEAALLAVLLEERPPLPRESDIGLLLETFEHSLHERSFSRYRKSVGKVLKTLDIEKYELIDARKAGLLVALAYPERVAKWRGEGSRYLTVSGKGLHLASSDSLERSPWLAVAEAGGSGKEGSIHTAAPLEEADLFELFEESLQTRDDYRWSREKERVEARRVTKLGAVVLRSEPVANPDSGRIAEALLPVIEKRGLQLLPWEKRSLSLRNRLRFARCHLGDTFVDVGDETLLRTLKEWLLPYMEGVAGMKELQGLDMYAVLRQMAGWEAMRRLERVAPERIEVPSGSKIAVDYSDPEAPVLAVRLQEIFGWRESPTLMEGRVPLTLHLLSPANRPLAVTRNLETFWQNAYPDIRKEMRGRYPKHYWPEDPLQARATRKTKKEMERKP